MDGKLQGKETIREFILGGMATFTIRSKTTGTRFTYRVKLAPRRSVDDERPYFVSLLHSENNTKDYVYLGCIWPESWRYACKTETPSSRAFQWLWKTLNKADPDLSELEFFHAGTCARCGKLLTVPESIESGWGPVCAKLRGG